MIRIRSRDGRDPIVIAGTVADTGTSDLKAQDKSEMYSPTVQPPLQ
jgi:hypothetical protein